MEARFRQILAAHPDLATFVGIHSEDERLPDGSREAVAEDIRQARRQRAAVEAIDPADLSPEVRFERDVELHNLGLELFGLEEQRQWEQRSTRDRRIGRSAVRPLCPRFRATR